ncbi:MAG: hypothetical protein KDJ35_04825 [Alphaproteobacteria bacterium]|nr:hypothetical protein [Alphaproteobacteria bacterium]
MFALLVFVLSFAVPSSAMAMEAVLGIRVKIVQCGPQYDLVKACKENEKCCGLLNSADLTQDDEKDKKDVKPFELSENAALE